MKKIIHILIAALCVILLPFTACSTDLQNNAETPHKINYTEGDTKEPASETAATGNSETEELPTTKNNVEQNYILNTNSKKFHYPSCASAQRISNKNKQEYLGTRTEILDKGYKPCGNCNP